MYVTEANSLGNKNIHRNRNIHINKKQRLIQKRIVVILYTLFNREVL